MLTAQLSGNWITQGNPTEAHEKITFTEKQTRGNVTI